MGANPLAAEGCVSSLVVASKALAVQLNFASREVTIKLVYYGPALSGKTTNLRALHALTSEESRGRLMTLETKDDRTLFFDVLPLVFRAEPSTPGGAKSSAMSLRVKVFTVPGQVLHVSTRRVVLQGADGVAFIADSQVSETQANTASFLDLRENLQELGVELSSLPLVIQFNKRDLPGIRSDQEIEAVARRGREPVFKASALHGSGVLESFFGLLQLTWAKLENEHHLARTLGIEAAGFLPMVARKIGYRGDVWSLVGAGIGGAIARPGPGQGP
jgi:signal recognition particle receptor subunit beta